MIGVVLSGLLSDGAAGLTPSSVAAGSPWFRPDEAIADEMPRRAMEATTVDLCVPSARIANVLSDLVRKARTALPVPPEIALEVEIAAGGRIGSGRLAQSPARTSWSCPSCGAVLSKLNAGNARVFVPRWVMRSRQFLDRGAARPGGRGAPRRFADRRRTDGISAAQGRGSQRLLLASCTPGA